MRILKSISDKALLDLDVFNSFLARGAAFTFVRFSDGETEILDNHFLELGKSGVIWSKGKSGYRYPDYDLKRFEPGEHSGLRSMLIESAKYTSDNYFKGIPARHNNANSSKQKLIELNGGSERNLTFADLFVNSNYPHFLRTTVKALQSRENVFVVGNFRMRVELVAEDWRLVSIPDDSFSAYEEVISKTLETLSALPSGSIVLSSASSLSNVIGWKMQAIRPDLTFIDIGTALHPQMGMGDSVREYHSQMLPWSPKNWRSKLGYHLNGSARLKW